MKINHGREFNARSQLRDGTFTGDVWGDPVVSGAEGVTVNNVLFVPGARTHWHRHSGAQILSVLGGRGHAYTRDGEGGEITAGDVVYVPPNEEHWHGAAADSFLLHTAISIGQHEWLQAVTDEEYAAVAKAAANAPTR